MKDCYYERESYCGRNECVILGVDAQYVLQDAFSGVQASSSDGGSGGGGSSSRSSSSGTNGSVEERSKELIKALSKSIRPVDERLGIYMSSAEEEDEEDEEYEDGSSSYIASDRLRHLLRDKPTAPALLMTTVPLSESSDRSNTLLFWHPRVAEDDNMSVGVGSVGDMRGMRGMRENGDGGEVREEKEEKDCKEDGDAFVPLTAMDHVRSPCN